MLAFIDESGDTGRKLLNNSSRYLVVAVIIFQNNSDAQACDDAIHQLRRELNLRAAYEFHYADNSPRVKEAFIRKVSVHRFTYHVCIINKAADSLTDASLEYGKELYKFAISKAIESAEPHLRNASVIIDESGGKRFGRELSAHLRQNLRDKGMERSARKLAMKNSEGNNLLQLADYVAGIVNRALQGRQREMSFMTQYLAPHEIGRQVL